MLKRSCDIGLVSCCCILVSSHNMHCCRLAGRPAAIARLTGISSCSRSGWSEQSDWLDCKRASPDMLLHQWPRYVLTTTSCVGQQAHGAINSITTGHPPAAWAIRDWQKHSSTGGQSKFFLLMRVLGSGHPLLIFLVQLQMLPQAQYNRRYASHKPGACCRRRSSCVRPTC